MQERKIVKVKLQAEDLVDIIYLEYPAVGSDETKEPDKVTHEGKHKAHPDLIQAFKNLDIHLATICEQGQYTDYEDKPENLEIFKATQISIGGEGEHEGLVLTGQRKLNHNNVLNINTPFEKLDPDQSDYSYAASMGEAVSGLLMEADEYLNGKYAPSRQYELELVDHKDENQDEDSRDGKAKKKGNGKSRKMKVASMEEELSEAAAGE